MDRRNNPYAPGAGLQPPELAGRDRLIEDVTIDMDRVLARRPIKGLVLLGLRGVGKTVLLNRLRAFADDKGFETTKIEAPDGGALPDLLAPELRRILYALDLRQAGGRHLRRTVNVLRGFANVFKVKIGDIQFSVEPASGEGDTGNLEQDLPRLLVAVAEAAAERRSAVGLFLDEIQYLSAVELAAVVVACHEIAQRNLPLLFIGAGLPQVAALAGKAKSYAERLFDYPEVGPLDSDAARAAIAIPAKKEGVSFDDGAVDAILQVAQNHPYFIQEWGFQVWNRAPSSPIVREVVAAATPDVIAPPGRQLFSSALRSLDRAATEVPARHGRARTGAAQDRASRHHSGRRRSLRGDGPATAGEQGHGLEPTARRDGVHRAALRQLHETTDADPPITHAGPPQKPHAPHGSPMNTRILWGGPHA